MLFILTIPLCLVRPVILVTVLIVILITVRVLDELDTDLMKLLLLLRIITDVGEAGVSLLVTVVTDAEPPGGHIIGLVSGQLIVLVTPQVLPQVEVTVLLTDIGGKTLFFSIFFTL